MLQKPPRFVAYYRVSTAKQGQSGLGLEAQKAAVLAHVRSTGGRLIEEFEEVESGKRADRPRLAEALLKAKLCNAVLVIAKLDRLARNQFFLHQLKAARTRFVCCDMPSANDLTIDIMAAVAEDEARRISERTKAALGAAKARGVKLGGGFPGIRNFAAAGARASAQSRRHRVNEWTSDIAAVIRQMDPACAVSLRSIAGELNARDFSTPRGMPWTAGQVKRVLDRVRLGQNSVAARSSI